MRSRSLVMTFLVGALSVTGCGDDKNSSIDASAGGTVATSAASAPTTATPTAATTAATTAGDRFQDSFDDDHNKWGVLDDSEFGSIAYESGDYVWAFKGIVAHWLPGVLGDQFDQGRLEMRNVVVKAQATVDKGGGVVGVFCRENTDTDAQFQWYEFVARDGYAAIRRADLEANLDVLAETDKVTVPLGKPIAFEAKCVDDAAGHAQLSFSLNGTPVLQATDNDPLGNGVAGLQAWTFPVHQEMDIRWHDFSVDQASA